MNTTISAARCAAARERKLNFLQLLLEPHTARQAARVRCFDFYVHSLPRGKERTKKARQRLPPLETASLPLCKMLHEKNIKIFYASPDGSHHERQAEKAKKFLLSVLFEIYANTGKEAQAKKVKYRKVRAT